jgi:hypothetical protein
MAPNQISKTENHRAKIRIRDIPDPNFCREIEYYSTGFSRFPQFLLTNT